MKYEDAIKKHEPLTLYGRRRRVALGEGMTYLAAFLIVPLVVEVGRVLIGWALND